MKTGYLMLVMIFNLLITFSQNGLRIEKNEIIKFEDLNNSSLKVADGNSTIATSYTNTQCGLNFTQASVYLSQKSFTFGQGSVQPAGLFVSGLSECTEIIKAFLYVSTSGNGIPITANLTNPLNVSVNYSLTVIGQNYDVCWGYPASYSYRADVTPIISGNGNYTISGIPVVPTPSNDAQGATLFIIYKDKTKNYSGSIVIADGALLGPPGWGTTTVNIGGFHVCETPMLTTNFMLVSDLQKQQDALVRLNNSAFNYTLTKPNQNVQNFIADNGTPASVNQTTAHYGLLAGNDCFNIVLAGMYFKTNCMTCTVAPENPPNTPTINVSSSSNPVCAGGSVVLTASGAPTYTWNNGINTPTVSFTPSITTNYWVYSSNANGCSNTIYTQSVITCTGLKEVYPNDLLHIYPIPSKGSIEIEFLSDFEDWQFKVYNLWGQLIVSKVIKGQITRINLDTPGYYNIIFESKNQEIIRRKIVIE